MTRLQTEEEKRFYVGVLRTETYSRMVNSAHTYIYIYTLNSAAPKPVQGWSTARTHTYIRLIYQFIIYVVCLNFVSRQVREQKRIPEKRREDVTRG